MKKLFLGVLILLAGSSAQAAVDYAKEIRPIFEANCYKCHGGTKHKGDFKLDSVAAIQKGGKDGKDIVPNDPEKSNVYHRITLKPDDDDIMPPSDKGKPLTKAQTDLIKQWISEGANYGDWKQDVVKETADAGGVNPAAGDAGPAAEVLPQVAAANPAVLEQLRASGAQALPLCQGSNLLSIEYTSSAATTTDQQISLLAQVAPQVYDLNLAGTKVTDSALSSLEGMTNLHRLHLEKTAVTDAGLSHLKNLTSLEYLNLYHTDVTNAGLDQLQPLKKLKNVYLWQSKVTEDGADGLKKAIPTVSIDLGWKEPPATQPAKPEAAKETAAG